MDCSRSLAQASSRRGRLARLILRSPLRLALTRKRRCHRTMAALRWSPAPPADHASRPPADPAGADGLRLRGEAAAAQSSLAAIDSIKAPADVARSGP